MPDPISEPELHQLVKMYQTHAHSKTCRRYKNLPCRFNFGHFFTNRTIVAKPLASYVNGKEKCDKLALQKTLLTKLKTVINETLNPSKKKLITLTAQSRTFYIHLTSQKMITIKHFLQQLEQIMSCIKSAHQIPVLSIIIVPLFEKHGKQIWIFSQFLITVNV